MTEPDVAVPITIRAATQEDQSTIKKLVREARINPRDLQWPHFVVAETNGEIVGVAQVRHYAGGSRELASLVVLPEFRGAGIAGKMIDELLAGETDRVFMLVDVRYAEHFSRWDFRRVPPQELPREMARQYRIGRVVTTIASVLLRRRIRIVALERPALSR